MFDAVEVITSWGEDWDSSPEFRESHREEGYAPVVGLRKTNPRNNEVYIAQSVVFFPDCRRALVSLLEEIGTSWCSPNIELISVVGEFLEVKLNLTDGTEETRRIRREDGR